MSWLRRLLRRTDDEQIQREVDEEIRTHLALRERDLRERGETPRAARAEAERRFGDLEHARRRLYASALRRDRRRGLRQWLESAAHDIRVAMRRFRAAPGHALFTVATLALGIALTTATYTLVEGVLLRPLPFPEAEELVSLRSVPEGGAAFPYVSSTNWYDWRDDNRSLAATGIRGFRERVTVTTGEQAFRVDGVRVGGGFFDVMRMPLLVGRGMSEEEIESRQPLAVVSEGFWRDVLAADPGLRQELTIDGTRTRIVGVVRAGHGHPEQVDVWLPAVYRRMSGAARNNINWLAVGRLRPGVSVEEARADLSAIADRIRAEEPEGIYSWGVGVVPLRDEVVGNSGETLWLLLGAAAAVLLIACANLAGLGLVQATSTQGEAATRLALGASRARIVRQQVIEQLLLSALGGLAGLATAAWLVGMLLARGDTPLPRTADVGIDGSVLAFAITVSVVAGLLSSLVPALRASRAGLRSAMGQGHRAVGGARTLPGAILVGAEVALAVVLLVGGGLLVRSYTTLTSRDLGFDPGRVLTADIALTSPRYHGEPQLWSEYWSRLLEQLRTIPGVGAVGLTSAPPTGGGSNSFIEIEGSDETGIGAHYYVVSDGYHETLGIPLLAGRDFGELDGADSERVVLVSRTMAERFWPGQSPLGRRVRATSMEGDRGVAPWLTVIGIAGDVRQWGFLDQPDAHMYVLYRQVPRRAGAMSVVARARGADIGAARTAVREAVVSVDPTIAPDMDTLEARLGDLLDERRLVLSTLNVFAALAVALASIGLYGLLSFAVTRRRRELAVRAALGASGLDLLGLVLSGAARVVLAGLAVGLLAAWWLARVIEALLVDVAARDPLTFAAVAAVLAAVGAAAALVPAIRAARQHPAQALRSG